MKSISSAIVAAAGLWGVITSVPLMTVFPIGGGLAAIAGFITLILGLIGWWTCLKHAR